MLEAVMELTEQLTDEEQRIFIFSEVVVASDKFIQKEHMDQIRGKINVTQISQMYEKDTLTGALLATLAGTVASILLARGMIA